MINALLPRIEQEHLFNGEAVSWFEPIEELPGHRLGLVENSINSVIGGDAVIHALVPRANNAAAWIVKRGILLHVSALEGGGWMTVMNLFKGKGGVFDRELGTTQPGFFLSYGDVHSCTNTGSELLVLLDQGYPALEEGDEKVAMTDCSAGDLDIVRMLTEQNTL